MVQQQALDKTGPAEDMKQLRQQLCTLIRNQTGHDFSGYKPSTFFRRVQRRMVVLRVSTLEGYIGALREEPAEVEALFRDPLISVTSFFRNPEFFGVIDEEVISALFQNKGPGDESRVWVRGCAGCWRAPALPPSFWISTRSSAALPGPPPRYSRSSPVTAAAG